MAPPVALEAPQVASVSSKASQYQGDPPAQSHAGTPLFKPEKHLAFSAPSKILQMLDLALEPTALSNVAITEPFPFLSHEAVLQHRQKLFSPDVLDNCLHHTRPESYSDIAGLELVPVMDYEISHTNVQLCPGGLEEVRNMPAEPPVVIEEAIPKFRREKDKERQSVTDQKKPIIEWHKDSHLFACVVMLLDARYMVGGETELMRGDGKTIKVKAPQMGCAVLLQGRHITHIAAPVTNMPKRVMIVTLFQPKNPNLLDEMMNANVRNKSHVCELYYQWMMYCLDILAECVWVARDILHKEYEDNVKNSDSEGKRGLCRVETVSVAEMQKWAEEQIAYIQQTMHEMRPLLQ